MTTMYRQGDVLLIAATRCGANAEPVARENGRVVLAHGEATGHAHALVDDHVTLGEVPTTKRRYLRIVKKPAALLHEEHAPIELPPGMYEVRRQREYSPEEIRTVAD